MKLCIKLPLVGAKDRTGREVHRRLCGNKAREKRETFQSHNQRKRCTNKQQPNLIRKYISTEHKTRTNARTKLAAITPLSQEFLHEYLQRRAHYFVSIILKISNTYIGSKFKKFDSSFTWSLTNYTIMANIE